MAKNEIEVNENYTERLVNAVAKTLAEAFENLTIEDVNMYQCGYNKAITELKNKICMHFADWQYSEDDKVIKDIIELASEAVGEIAEEMRSVTGSSQEE